MSKLKRCEKCKHKWIYQDTIKSYHPEIKEFMFIKEALEDTKKKEEQEKEKNELRSDLARKYPEDSNIKIEEFVFKYFGIFYCEKCLKIRKKLLFIYDEEFGEIK